MRDILLQCAGVAAIAVALITARSAKPKCFARATNRAGAIADTIRLVWQAGTSRDRRRRAADRSTLDGVGAGPALDHRDAGLCVWIWPLCQCWAMRGPAFMAGSR